MSAVDLDGILAFLRAAERLKTVTRSGWTSTGQPESVAEHTWRLCLMAMLLYGRSPGVDLARLLRMCLIHDLGEAIRGDVPAPAQAAPGAKSADERADLLELTAPLPAALREEIVALWDEYEAAQSTEARLAKGLDRAAAPSQRSQAETGHGILDRPGRSGGMADAGDSKSPARKGVPVRVRPPAPRR